MAPPPPLRTRVRLLPWFKQAAPWATTGAGLVSETGGPPTYTVEVRDTTSVSSANPARRFMRLRVTSP